MALTLETILATAQNGQKRHPLCEIISDTTVAAIPFDGSLLTTGTTDETDPNSITHSSGRISAVYIEDGNKIHYVYTNTERSEFTNVIANTSPGTVNGVTLCELSDGNIGIAWIETYSGNYRLRSMIVSPVGDEVSSVQTIATWATSGGYSGSPFAVALR